ncbi:hypothetical protein EsH8_VI_001226 [Colletotrichum jinshuiense]
MAEQVQHDSDEEEYLTSPPPEGFEPKASREFLDLFRKEDAKRIVLEYHDAGLPDNIEFRDLMRWVTDPDTGDTALHAAAAAGNIDAFSAITKSFGRNWFPNAWLRTCVIAVFIQRNKAGDSLFHVAARAGRQDVVTSAWRYLFTHHYNWDRPPFESGSDVYVPLDENLPEFQDDPPYVPDYMVAIILLARKNAAGNTAADEAANAGHDDVAEWLKQVLDRLTLGGKRATESRMARMEELVDGRYNIDKHHITEDQFPTIKRRWMQVQSDGTAIWGDC